MGDSKKNNVTIRQVINIAVYTWRKKLAKASYSNPNELLNQNQKYLSFVSIKSLVAWSVNYDIFFMQILFFLVAF